MGVVWLKWAWLTKISCALHAHLHVSSQKLPEQNPVSATSTTNVLFLPTM